MRAATPSKGSARELSDRSRLDPEVVKRARTLMHQLIYLVGLVVVIMAILSLFGLR
jgi:hypothetical protein